MAVEKITQVKRTIWDAKCPQCGEGDVRTENPPKERFCGTCKVWVPFEEQSFTGPEVG